MTEYQDKQAAFLKRRVIVDVQIEDGFPIIVLDNGVCVVIQQDDEGNGPGSIALQHIDGTAIDVYKDSPPMVSISKRARKR